MNRREFNKTTVMASVGALIPLNCDTPSPFLNPQNIEKLCGELWPSKNKDSHEDFAGLLSDLQEHHPKVRTVEDLRRNIFHNFITAMLHEQKMIEKCSNSVDLSDHAAKSSCETRMKRKVFFQHVGLTRNCFKAWNLSSEEC